MLCSYRELPGGEVLVISTFFSFPCDLSLATPRQVSYYCCVSDGDKSFLWVEAI